MKWYFYICTMILLFCFGCNTTLPKMASMSIIDYKTSGNQLHIDYKIQNSLPETIWVCEDVSIYLPFDDICDIRKNTLYINRKVSAFPGPDQVYFDQPMIGKYIKLEPRQIVNCSIDISLFDKFVTFSEYPPSSSEIDNVVLSIGYINSLLCKKYLGLAKINENLYNTCYDELPEYVREKHPNLNNPEILYVPHYWEGIKNEKSFDFSLSLMEPIRPSYDTPCEAQ